MVYDNVAADYDATWTKPSDLAENEAVVRLIDSLDLRQDGPISVLDAGCGTGLALDLGIVDFPRGDTYYGFDPSQGMLSILRDKYPTADVMQATASEFLRASDMRADLVIGLFAAPSYMTPDDLDALVARAKRAVVLMTYDGTWLPDYYDIDNPAPVATFDSSMDHLAWQSGLNGWERSKIGAFDVTVVRR